MFLHFGFRIGGFVVARRHCLSAALAQESVEGRAASTGSRGVENLVYYLKSFSCGVRTSY